MQPLRRTYGCNGIGLSVLEAGPADGRLVILLHGFPEDAQSWLAQMTALADAGLRVIAPDQRGYGESDKPRGVGAYRIDRLAGDIAALATALGQARFDVVGHDWGGVVAWYLAADEPQKVERLAILNAPHPSAMGRYMRQTPSQARRSAYIALFQLPVLPELILRAGDGAVLSRTLSRSSHPGAFPKAELARLRQGWGGPGAMTAMLNWYRALRARPRRPGAVRILAPTLILWGVQDAFLGRGLAPTSVEFCDRAEIVYLEDATHWLHHEQVDAVNAALVGFLAPNAAAAEA